MSTAPRLSVLVPAFNEEIYLADTVRGALACLDASGQTFELIVIDDGSNDQTPAVIRTLSEEDRRIRVVTHATNRGLGASYFSGVSVARGEYVTWIPGDDAIPSQALAVLVAEIGRADVVVGYPRFAVPRPFVRRLLSGAYTALMNRVFGLRLRYFNCVTVVRRQLLEPMAASAHSGFGVFAEILVRLAYAGHSLVEVGIESQNRQLAKSKAFRWRNVASVIRNVVWLWWDLRVRRHPVVGHAPVSAGIDR